jgi:hypothetical protein
MSQEEFGQLYWNGVRDALRMVETFVFWKEKNPREKRTIKDFVSEALEAVRQKCAPCLKEILGINFGPVEEEATSEPAFKFAPEPVEEELEPEPLEEPAPEPAEEPMPEPIEEPEERTTSRQPDVFLAPEEEAEPELPTPEPEETRAPEPKPFAVQDVSRPSPAPAALKPAEPEKEEKPKRRTFFF